MRLLRRRAIAFLLGTVIVVVPSLAQGREVGAATAPKLPDAGNLAKDAAGQFNPKVSAYFWLMAFEGALRFDSANGLTGSELTTSQDLGIPKEKGTPGMEGEIAIGGNHIFRLDMTKQSFAGSQTLTAPLIVNGVSFPAKALVSASFDYLMGNVSYGYAFDRNDKGYLAVRGGVSYLSVTSAITSAGVTSNGFAHQVFAPFLGVEFLYNPVVWVGTRLTVDYFPAGNAPYTGGVALLFIRPTKAIEATVGYRYQKIDDTNGRLSFITTMAGPVVTLALSF